MGYLSFDCSQKIHASGKSTSTKTSKTGFNIEGIFRHVSRNLDKENGCEVSHSNENIDPDRTSQNEDFFKDSNGEWQRAKSKKDMINAVERRVQYAREHGARISSKGKNDTVIARGLVLAMSNDSIAGNEDNWKKDSIEILEEIFGKENIVCWSCHMDEQTPHLHILFVPCYVTEKNGEKKCSINQTKFFKSPKQLASLHRQIRKELLKKNYSIEQENKSIDKQLAGYYDKNGEWHQQGLSPDQLKSLSNKELKLRLEMINMRIREEDLDIWEKNVLEMSEQAKARQEEMERKYEKKCEALSTQQTALENDRASLQTKEYDLFIKEMKVQKMEEDAENKKREAEEMFEKATSISEICNQILSEEKHLNAKFLEFLDREGKRTGKKIRESVEILFKRFQNERRKNVSDWQLEMLRLRNERLKNGNANTDNGMDIIDITDTGYDFSA